MKKVEEGFTYILERQGSKIKGQGVRRFYVGRTIDLERRLKEHQKDGRQNYKLVWWVEGNFESKIKKFGAVIFMECMREGVSMKKNDGKA